MDEVRISYRLVSNGTTLMETMDSGHDTSMVTMYHVDGSRILATHYCAAGNQPRMAARRPLPRREDVCPSASSTPRTSRPTARSCRGSSSRSTAPTDFAAGLDLADGAKGKDQVGTFTYSRVR